MELENIVTGFKTIDASVDPDFYLKFLRGVEALEDARSVKKIMREAVNFGEGKAGLDVGCGDGTEVLAFAKAAGPNGRAVGIDAGSNMIQAAKKRAAKVGVSAHFEIGDVHNLQFEDNTFDACRAERVFMYLRDPEIALGEMIRVTKLGGRVVIFDFNFDCHFIEGADPVVTRKFIRFMSDTFPNERIGSQLNAHFKKAGLKNVISTPHPMRYTLEFARYLLSGLFADSIKAGIMTDKEATDWWAKLEESNAKGQYSAGIFGFIIQGQK